MTWVPVMLAFAGLLAAASAQALEVGPGDDWCGALNGLAAGEELVLRPGEYDGACTIRRGGSPGAPVVVRALDLANRPRIVYGGRTNNVLNVRAGHVTIRGLDFAPTQANVDGIRIYRGDGVTVEACRFTGIHGIAVVANHGSLRDLVIRRNEIRQSEATAMYVGCHDGGGCVMSDVVIEGNYVHGVRADPGEIGYGVQVKLNSVATIRDNVFVDTKGPGIMVYGARDVGRVSLIERNFVMRSGTSSGIVVGGGPVVVRNNVAVGSKEAGIGLEDYGRRGLLRGILVAHNTVYGNDGGGITVPPEGRLEARLVNNAVHAPVGKPALPTRAEVVRLGNVECPPGACFAAAETRDFGFLTPPTGLVVSIPGMPADDYFGQPRGVPPVVGAVERGSGPIPLGPKAPAP